MFARAGAFALGAAWAPAGAAPSPAPSDAGTPAFAAGTHAADTTSRRTLRPPGPLPSTPERSSPESAARRRARGDAFTRSPAGASPFSPARASGAPAGRVPPAVGFAGAEAVVDFVGAEAVVGF